MEAVVELIKHAVIGYLMAFIGLLSPGLLTMTVLNTTIDRGKRAGYFFALGVIIPIFFQAHIALIASDYLVKHTEIIKSFSKVAVFVFLLLSVFFFHQFLNRNNHKSSLKGLNLSIDSSFLYGIFISLINPLAIPFYFSYSTLLEFKGYLILQEPYISVFVISAMLGALSILMIYTKYATDLLGRIQFVSRNFKLILALVMLFLAIASFVSGYSGLL